MRNVLHESYELVERGVINTDDFRDFVFSNPVRQWAGMNQDFFKGTVVRARRISACVLLMPDNLRRGWSDRTAASVTRAGISVPDLQRVKTTGARRSTAAGMG